MAAQQSLPSVFQLCTIPVPDIFTLRVQLNVRVLGGSTTVCGTGAEIPMKISPML